MISNFFSAIFVPPARKATLDNCPSSMMFDARFAHWRSIGRSVKHLGPAYARLSTGKGKWSGRCRWLLLHTIGTSQSAHRKSYYDLLSIS
jgi:hypothetical protein